MRRPPYTECRLYYDAGLRRGVEVGHYLLTPGGSGYFITALRHNQHRPGRVHLTCLRWPPEEIPGDAKVHPLVWYPRKRREGRRLQ